MPRSVACPDAFLPTASIRQENISRVILRAERAGGLAGTVRLSSIALMAFRPDDDSDRQPGLRFFPPVALQPEDGPALKPASRAPIIPDFRLEPTFGFCLWIVDARPETQVAT
ncbi:hypothetical protein [Bradyrhizobium sp. B024]|uniref:hypothetical protein n=1 Tax=Bradyrhizobium sp. B024 TaxID=3140247 RepID=UPI001B475F54|nr:hypothetical protein [Bradyrhizobium japonicum]